VNILAPSAPTFDLSKYLQASKEACAECLDSLCIEMARGGIRAQVRFQHLRFDPKTGEPMFQRLAECLADHLTTYSFSARRRGKPITDADRHKLHREARDLLRRDPQSGESGEVLIYFLVETILDAPQVVAKMDLKTNRKVESLGSDGIHMNWNASERWLDVYFAEAKLEKSVGAAVSNAVKSLKRFHSERQYEHELRLVTGHFKHADERARRAIVRIIENKELGAECRLRHACLVGYNWPEYKKLPDLIAGELTAEFRKRYDADRERLHELVEKHFAGFKRKTLEFEIFFLPFASVQEFRDAFYQAI
jgi:Cap4 SAVED domain